MTKINYGLPWSTSLRALRPAQHIAEHRVRRLVVLSKLLKLTSTASTFGTLLYVLFLNSPYDSPGYATWFPRSFGTRLAPQFLDRKSCYRITVPTPSCCPKRGTNWRKTEQTDRQGRALSSKLRIFVTPSGVTLIRASRRALAYYAI